MVFERKEIKKYDTHFHDVKTFSDVRYINKEGKEYLVHRTIIEDWKPIRYWEVVVENGREETAKKEKIKNEE